MPRCAGSGAAVAARRAPIVLALVLATMAVVGLSSPPSVAATDLCATTTVPAGMVRYDWVGDGPGDPRAWSNNQNWRTTPTLPPDRTAPNYFGAPDSDTSTTGFVCIDPLEDGVAGSSTTAIDLDGDVNVHVVALNIAPGTSINLTGNARVFAHGDPATYLSHVRPGAQVDLAASTLGGRGTWLVEGDLTWRSLGPGLAATLDADFCEVAAVLACGSGGPGVLRLGNGGLLDVTGGDVNLKDGYTVEVGSGGRFRLATGSVAADRSSAIDVLAGGTLELAGDTNVFEGFAVGRPDGDLADLTNEGAVVKTAGTSTSALNVDYAGAGAVVVETGTISITNGTAAPVTVAPGRSLSTGQCPGGPVGGTTTCLTTTTATDTQLATLTQPGDETADADVVLVEEDTITDGALQPPVTVAVSAPDSRRVTRLAFEYLRTAIPAFPSTDRVAIFHGRATTRPRRIPDCDAGRIPRGVTACLLSRGTPSANRLTVSVLTNRPDGQWTVRRRGDRPTAITHTAVRAAEGVFRNDSGTQLDLRWTSDTGPGCAAPGPGATGLGYAYRSRAADQHALVWTPSDTGHARGLRAPLTDLADVRRIDVGLDTLDDRAAGVAVLTRWHTPTQRWRGVAPVSRADSDPAGITGQPRWRVLELSGLDFEWRRYTDGVADGAVASGTLGELLADHPVDKTTSAPDDEVFVGLGCSGEAFALDDLRLIRDDAPDLRWDLEPVRVTGDFVARTTPFVGGPVGCGISFRDYPHQVTRQVDLDAAADYQVLWSSTPRAVDGFRVLSSGRARAGLSTVRFPVRRTGFVVLRLRSSDVRRGSSTGAYVVRAVPRVDLRKITKRVPTGRSVVVTGRVVPAGRHRVTLYRTSPSAPTLRAVGSTVRTQRNGTFRLRVRATSPGRFAFAVYVTPPAGLDRAMSRTVLRTQVFRPRPAPVPPVQPAPVTIPVSQQPVLPIPPIIHLRGTQFRAAEARAARCSYRFGW